MPSFREEVVGGELYASGDQYTRYNADNDSCGDQATYRYAEVIGGLAVEADSGVIVRWYDTVAHVVIGLYPVRY